MKRLPVKHYASEIFFNDKRLDTAPILNQADIPQKGEGFSIETAIGHYTGIVKQVNHKFALAENDSYLHIIQIYMEEE